MLRTLAVPVLLLALAPQPTTTATPSASPQPSSTFGAPIGLPSLQMQVPADVRRHLVDFQQMVDQQRDFRRTVLAALTPDHRALLSRIIGEMAVADDPDPPTAAARLNAALSPAEKQTIIGAQVAQQIALLQHFAQLAAAQSPGPMPRPPAPPESSALVPPPSTSVPLPAVQGQVTFGVGPPAGASVTAIGNDAGMILLRTAVTVLSAPTVITNGIMPMPMPMLIHPESAERHA